MVKKTNNPAKKGKSRVFIIVFLLLMISAIAGVVGYNYYNKIYAPNVQLDEKFYLYIPSGSNFEDVLQSLEENNIIKDKGSFEWLADEMKYTERVKAGKYKLQPNMSNRELLILLRSGNQTPIQLTFNKFRLKESLLAAVSKKIEADSVEMQMLFSDEVFLREHGFTPENVMSIFLPNTYEVNWNTSAREFFLRMFDEYTNFWTEERLKQAEKIGLTQQEVATIASIVDEETNAVEEKSTIAGVYINRWKKGMLLQADPTVKYAVGDFSIRRVLYKHLETDSKYNTYMYAGLPPGPICTPALATLDAVLNYEKHDYIYFCAKGFSGRHAFAKTLYQHNQNAKAFHKLMNENGIR